MIRFLIALSFIFWASFAHGEEVPSVCLKNSLKQQSEAIEPANECEKKGFGWKQTESGQCHFSMENIDTGEHPCDLALRQRAEDAMRKIEKEAEEMNLRDDAVAQYNEHLQSLLGCGPLLEEEKGVSWCKKVIFDQKYPKICKSIVSSGGESGRYCIQIKKAYLKRG